LNGSSRLATNACLLPTFLKGMRRNVTSLEIKYKLISNVLENTPCFTFLNLGTVLHTLKLRKCLHIRGYHRTYENCPSSMWIPLYSCIFRCRRNRGRNRHKLPAASRA